MENRKIRVAITHGDTNGIGYELIFKTFADPAMLELCTPIIYGSPKVAAYHRNVLNNQANFTIINKAEDARDGRINLLTTFDEEVKVEIGNVSTDSSRAAATALKKAISDYGQGGFDVLVTVPVDAEGFQALGMEASSQTKYIEQLTGNKDSAMTILVNESVRVAILTPQIPVKEAIPAITKESIVSKTILFHESLKRDFRVSSPRIAILTLNPENSNGKEESDILVPAINELEEKGIQAFGPYPADSFFGNNMNDAFDGIIAMYHDQGTIPFKTLDNGNGITYTTGLPFVRTSTIHGAIIEQAGKGTVDESSFRHAVYQAIDICRNRANYEEPLRNPLKKLYHEKRDDSEKVRFAIPKQ